MNLQEELKALKDRIAELEEQAKREQEFPQYGDEYWYLSSSGEVMNTMCGDYDFEIDRLELGNVFKNKEQVEFAVEKLRVEAELRKFSTSFVLYNENWFLVLADTQQDVMPLYENREVTQGAIYFESKEKAEEAVKSVGEERIKKYIFGVED